MSCCGEKRNRIQHDPYNHSGEDSGKMNDHSVRAPDNSIFKYTGTTGMTVKGSITGNIYRFDNPGASLEVDRRDAVFMTGIPNLRKVLSVEY